MHLKCYGLSQIPPIRMMKSWNISLALVNCGHISVPDELKPRVYSLKAWWSFQRGMTNSWFWLSEVQNFQCFLFSCRMNFLHFFAFIVFNLELYGSAVLESISVLSILTYGCFLLLERCHTYHAQLIIKGLSLCEMSEEVSSAPDTA